MSLQLKYTTALCVTLLCHFVWLINLHAFSSPHKYHHPPSTTVGTTPASATPTQLSDQTQLHVPFISTGARLALWLQRKSLVPVNNLFSNSSKGPPLSLDIRLAVERWMGGSEWNSRGRKWSVWWEVIGGRETRSYPSTQRLWSQFIMDSNAAQRSTQPVLSLNSAPTTKVSLGAPCLVSCVFWSSPWLDVNHDETDSDPFFIFFTAPRAMGVQDTFL